MQWIFHAEPRVLSVSVHEKAYGFFPGTGGLEERATGEGLGATLSVPLPPFAGDGPFLAAVDRVVVSAVRAFRPQALVTHLGADTHHATRSRISRSRSGPSSASTRRCSTS